MRPLSLDHEEKAVRVVTVTVSDNTGAANQEAR